MKNRKKHVKQISLTMRTMEQGNLPTIRGNHDLKRLLETKKSSIRVVPKIPVKSGLESSLWGKTDVRQLPGMSKVIPGGRLVGTTLLTASNSIRSYVTNKGFGLSVQGLKLLDSVLTHLTSYSLKFSEYTDPFLSVLLREDMKKRLSGPLVEDLGMKSTNETIIQLPYKNGARLLRLYRKYNMPFKLIPNCSRFILNEKKYDGLAMLFGYPLKAKSNDIEIRNGKNGDANTFLVSAFLEMKTYKDLFGKEKLPTGSRNKKGSEMYMKRAGRLMKARAYVVSSLNFIFPNWYQDMSLKQVYKLISQVQELVKQRATKIEYSRTYIPKKTDAQGNPLLNEEGEGTGIRPLGVPSHAGRIYLHMLNNIIVGGRTGREGSQHAYFPNKGVGTAGAEIMDYVDMPYIYEFDLKSFFDNVDLEILHEKTGRELGLPKEFADFLKTLNQSIIKLQKKDKIDEPERKIRMTPELTVNPNLPKKYQPRRTEGGSDTEEVKDRQLKIRDLPLKQMGGLRSLVYGVDSKGESLKVDKIIQKLKPGDSTLLAGKKITVKSVSKGTVELITKLGKKSYATFAEFPIPEGMRLATPKEQTEKEKLLARFLKITKMSANELKFAEEDYSQLKLPNSVAYLKSPYVKMTEEEIEELKGGKSAEELDDGIIVPEKDDKTKDPGLDADGDLKLDQFEELEKDYPQVLKEKGVPQGCPTSCGLSTIALEILTQNNFPGINFDPLNGDRGVHIVMYADDGIVFSRNPEGIEAVKNYLKLIKVGIKEEGSSFVKQNGRWQKPLKFCGLEYDGTTQRMKAATRRGSTLEFDDVSMFLSFLLASREEIIYGGSASHLNSRLEKYEGMSPKEGINNELWRFLYMENPARLLFAKTSGYFLSALYANSFNLTTPMEKELLFKRKSWISKRGYSYQQETLKKCMLRLFESEYQLCRKQLGLELPRMTTRKELEEFADGLKGLKNQSRLEALLRLYLKLSGSRSQKVETMNIGVDINGNTAFKGKLDERELTLLGSLMSLDVYNASSYACNDLLCQIEYPVGKIQFVLEEVKPRRPEDYPRTAEKLRKELKAIRRNFRRYSGVPLLLKPLGINVRPGKSEKFLDLRGYYRKFSSISKLEPKKFSGSETRVLWIEKSNYSNDYKLMLIFGEGIKRTLKGALYIICGLVIIEFGNLEGYKETPGERYQKLLFEESMSPTDSGSAWLISWVNDEPVNRSWINWLWERGIFGKEPFTPEPLVKVCECCDGTYMQSFWILVLGLLGLGFVMIILNPNFGQLKMDQMNERNSEVMESGGRQIETHIDYYYGRTLKRIESALGRKEEITVISEKECTESDFSIVVTPPSPQIPVVRTSGYEVKNSETVGNGSGYLDVISGSEKESSVKKSSEMMNLKSGYSEATNTKKAVGDHDLTNAEILENYLQKKGYGRHSEEVRKRGDLEFETSQLERVEESRTQLGENGSITTVKQSSEVMNLKGGDGLCGLEIRNEDLSRGNEDWGLLEWMTGWAQICSDEYYEISHNFLESGIDGVVEHSEAGPLQSGIAYNPFTEEVMYFTDMGTHVGYFIS